MIESSWTPTALTLSSAPTSFSRLARAVLASLACRAVRVSGHDTLSTGITAQVTSAGLDDPQYVLSLSEARGSPRRETDDLHPGFVRLVWASSLRRSPS